MRSARAHNVVLLDDEDFLLRPLTLVSSARGPEGDEVTVRHELQRGTHTRTLRFVPPRTVVIVDEVVANPGTTCHATQLFHAAPGLSVERTEGGGIVLRADDGATCQLDQNAQVGAWSWVEGATEPELQGWYSPEFRKIVPNIALRYGSTEPRAQHRFVTRIELAPRDTGR